MMKIIPKGDDHDNWAEEINKAIQEDNKVNTDLAISLYTGTSKKGKNFEAVRVQIGEYETLIFPNKFELKYIKSVL